MNSTPVPNGTTRPSHAQTTAAEKHPLHEIFAASAAVATGGESSRLELSQIFVPPLLKPALARLEEGFRCYLADAAAQEEFRSLLRDFAGRPTPLTEAKNLARKWGAARIFLKREDLVHGGAHKLNNALGQCHLAKHMGFEEVIAETGAGQHGVATAIAAAKLGLRVRVYQGKKDVDRQRPNALRMRLFGASLHPVSDGQATLKEAVNAAMRDWVGSYARSAYCLGSIVGRTPIPLSCATFKA